MHEGPVRDLAEKLRVTAALLGCANQKELCAAFHRVNPNSDFDLERSYKWMQGRAVPRSARVYGDWAVLVDLPGAPPSWIASCGLGAFVDALCGWHGPEHEALLRQAERVGGRGGGGWSASAHPAAYLCGACACYSHAQSPYYRGRLIRGALVIATAARRTDGLVATYSQALAMGRAQATGTAALAGGAFCLDLRSTSTGVSPVFCSLFRPSPLASVPAGILCGVTAVHPGGQPPYATRIAMVRVPDSGAAELERSNRYLDAADGPLSRDLAALGLRPHAAAVLDAEPDRFLRPVPEAAGCDQASIAGYAALAMACDRMWMDGSAGGAPGPVAPADDAVPQRASLDAGLEAGPAPSDGRS